VSDSCPISVKAIILEQFIFQGKDKLFENLIYFMFDMISILILFKVFSSKVTVLL